MSRRTWGMVIGASSIILAIRAEHAPAQVQAAAAKPAAVVNGEPIALAEVEAVVKMRATPTPLSDEQRRHLRLDALSMLIDDLLMQQFLRKHGPKIDPAEVDRQFADLQTGLKSQGLTLEQYYLDTGQSEAELRRNILHMLQWAGYVKDRPIPEEKIKQYYQENKEFFDQVEVRASHIVLRLDPKATESERQAVHLKLLAMRQDILAGKLDFAEAAKKHSQCPSALDGGNIGYFQRKWMMDEAFAKAAFALKTGELSDVVRTEAGLHLIKVTDRKLGRPSSYETIKKEVHGCCVEEMRQVLMAEQKKAAQIEIYLP